MPCTRRLKAYRGFDGGIVFDSAKGYYDQHLSIACGQCMDCRLRRSRDWALRMMHESQLHERSCFLTLTYNQAHLPEDHSLNVRDWQLFAKRLRKRVGKFRFFHVGEYGERSLRPHYHACIFGQDFSKDRELYRTLGTHQLYTSPILDEVWGKGHHLIGSLTFDSACYVARYVTKKVTGDQADAHYERVDPETGECWSVKPEYSTQSRRPGIGSGWFEKFGDEVYPDDFVISKGNKYPPPKFYDRIYEAQHEQQHSEVVQRRRKRAIAAAGRQDPTDNRDRDRDRETITRAKLNLRRGALDR